MSKIEEILHNLKFNLPNVKMVKENIDLNLPYEQVSKIESKPGKYCGISEISNIFSWKKGFSYLFTGTPGTGKTTMILFLMLLMSYKYGYKWCIWTPEMEDSYLKNKSVNYHAKDLIYLMIWTLAGVTPYEHYAKNHNCDLLSESKIETLYNWVIDHFKFIHINDRTPAGLIEAFSEQKNKHDVDGFLIDPWKSVKQDMNGMRSDLWMEDTLMEFKTFSLESDSIINFIVHPKSLKDYKDANGNFRVITPFDLNGGAAWNNSMDVIISLRKLEARTEWHSLKIRKQHLVGQVGSYESITFNKNEYRFSFGLSDPFNKGENNSFYDYSNQDTGEVIEPKF